MLTHPGSRQGSKENLTRDGGKETSKEGNAAAGWWIDHCSDIKSNSNWAIRIAWGWPQHLYTTSTSSDMTDSRSKVVCTWWRELPTSQQEMTARRSPRTSPRREFLGLARGVMHRSCRMSLYATSVLSSCISIWCNENGPRRNEEDGKNIEWTVKEYSQCCFCNVLWLHWVLTTERF